MESYFYMKKGGIGYGKVYKFPIVDIRKDEMG